MTDAPSLEERMVRHSGRCQKQWREDIDARHVPHCICGVGAAPMTPAQPAPVDHKTATYDASCLVDDPRPQDEKWLTHLARAYLARSAENEALTEEREAQRAGVLQMTRYLAEANARAEASEATAARLRKLLIEARNKLAGGIETEHELEAEHSKVARKLVARIAAELEGAKP